MCYAPFNSKLAYSADGIHWHVNEMVEPYSYIVEFKDEKKENSNSTRSDIFWRVERPQLVFAKVYSNLTLADPIALFNGVCNDGVACLDGSSKVILKTWTLARPFRGHD